jgi:uncharacterized protein
MTAVGNLADFRALDPFFRIIEEGAAGLADGGTSSTCWPRTSFFEYVITVPGYPQGRVIPTGGACGNRYISVLSIVDRKIAHWRDYLDPIAVFDAVGWRATAGQG